MTRKIIAFILVAVFSFTIGTVVTNAYVIRYESGFSPVPTKVYGYYDFTEATKTAIHNACLTWNNAGVGNLVYRSTSTHTNTTYPLLNGKNEITKGYRDDEEYLMQATLSPLSGSSVTEVDIDINVNHNFGEASAGSFDTQSVITHELGHLLGLWDERQTCVMYYQISSGVQRRNLYQDDKNGILSIYQ